MDTGDLGQWQPNDTEQSVAEQLLGHLATRFPLTTHERLQEVAETVTYAGRLLAGSGPAVAPRGRNNVGSMIVSAIRHGRLHELAAFAETRTGSDEPELLVQRPTLLADLDTAESALAQLAEKLEIISPPLIAR